MYLPHDKYLLMSFYAAWFCSDSVCSAWYSVSFWKVPCKHGSVLTFDPLYVYNISLLTDGFLGKRDHFLYLVWQFLFSPICRESHWCWQNATIRRLFLDFLYWKKNNLATEMRLISFSIHYFDLWSLFQWALLLVIIFSLIAPFCHCT